MALNFSLRRERHAIGEFTATLQFFNPISPAGFTNVLTALGEMAQRFKLPAQMPMNLLEVSFGQPFMINAPVGQNATFAGYQRFSEIGEVAESLRCDLVSINYTLRDYSTWDEIKPRLLAIFSELSAIYAAEVPAINSIRVQYVNEFMAKEAKTVSVSEIFREGTPWIAGFHLYSSDAWHCHVGNFIPKDEIQRNLVNVNCDISLATSVPDEAMRTYVKVLILAGCYYNIPEKSPLIIDLSTLEQTLSEVLEEAHDLEKKVLEEVISDDYLIAIGALDGK